MASIRTSNTEETKKVGQNLAENIRKSGAQKNLICLYGDLGAGKTIFVKGFVEAFGVDQKNVKSPTYTYVRQIDLNGITLYHFDFYRILLGDDMIHHELEQMLNKEKAIVIVEWPDRIEATLQGRDRTSVKISYISENERQIDIS